MKHLLLFVITITLYSTAKAQSSFPSERIFVIASLQDNTFQPLDYSVSDLGIKSKISWILKLNAKDFDLINPTFLNEPGKGWYLQFEFNSSLYAGIYKEKLRLKDDKLIITESRSAQMAIATNCNEIVFSDDENHCKCVNKKDVNLDSILKYRLFSSVN
ncbi:hypothetical protein [Psychroserpens sp. S379A]|uniref:hypothetical protein n=1 Tax=Psychroserpens sp. S379A TaxID=3415137 RepID=UPI003C7B2FB9